MMGSEEAVAGRSGSGRRPGWLERVMGPERGFFEGCGEHSNLRKNEKNIFCLRCCLSLCPHCLPSHPSHPLLQVRRYVYHDVIRLGDLEKLIDCSYIQPYTINGAKVIFLDERPQSRSGKGSAAANICLNCDRILQEPFQFCSLQCKVDHLVYKGEDLSDVLQRFDESDFSISQFEGLRMDGTFDQFGDGAAGAHQTISNTTATYSSSILDDQDDQGLEPEKGMSSRNAADCVDSSNRDAINVEMAKRDKKKRSGKGSSGIFSAAGIAMTSSSPGSRRKGAPQRAPFS